MVTRREGVARWIELGKWIGVPWLLSMLYVLSPGSPWITGLLAVVLVAASPVFVLVAVFVVTAAAAGWVLLLQGSTDNTVFLVVFAVLAPVFAWRHCLLESPERASWIVRCFGRVRGLFLAAALISLSLLLFRSIPIYCAVTWGVIFLCVHRELSRHKAAPETARRWSWANLLLLSASALLSMAVLESGARLVYPDFGRLGETEAFAGIFRFHPEYLFITAPSGHLDYDVKTAPSEVRIQALNTSAQGLRDRIHGPKARDEYRILMLGDSFTMGISVDEDKTIPTGLERLLKERVGAKRISEVNAGLAGAGPLSEWGMLQEYGWALDPDLVILQIFPANDIDNSLEAAGKGLRAYNLEWKSFVRRLFLMRTLPCRADWWLNRHCAAYHALASAVFQEKLAARLISDLRWYTPPVLPPLPPFPSRRALMESNLTDWYPELYEGYGFFKGYVRKIRDDCRNHGVDLVAYCIPELDEMDDAKWAEVLDSDKGGTGYERFKAMRLMNGFLAEERIPCVSVVEALQARGTIIDDLYFPLDRHLTAYGNGVVAERLCDFLLKEFEPGRRPFPKPPE